MSLVSLFTVQYIVSSLDVVNMVLGNFKGLVSGGPLSRFGLDNQHSRAVVVAELE